MLKVLAMMLACAPVMAGSLYLNPPPYPWAAGVGHSNVSQAFVLGFDGNGNPTGICTYYNSHGTPVYASCGWDLSGNALYNTPLSITPYQVSLLESLNGKPFGQVPLPNGAEYIGWTMATLNGDTVYILDVYPERRSVLVTP